MDLQGPDYSGSRDPIFSYFRDPMIIVADSRDPVFNSSIAPFSQPYGGKRCFRFSR